MIQFFDTVKQIINCESVTTPLGICRHLAWQSRKILHWFPVELRIAESKLRVDRPCGVAALVNAMGQYDFNNMKLVHSVLSKTNGTLIDIGANIGSYTMIASEVRGATIVSIEPHPVTFDWLRNNVQLNGRHNVTCLNLAISDRDAQVGFTDGKEASTNRVASLGEEVAPILAVNGRRLESICDDLRIVPDFVKIDVEGYEFEVLQGFGKYGSVTKLIIVENGERTNIRAWMLEAGFVGPLFVHVNRGVLSSEKQRRPEDPVYIKRAFLGCVQDLGFAISN